MGAMVWVILIKASGRYFFILDHDHSVMAFETEAEGVAHFENGYNNFHARSYESSMSAAINWMTFQPSIVQSTGLEELVQWVGERPVVNRLSNVSGQMLGMEVEPELGAKLWEAGKKPALITEDFNRIKAEQLRKELERLETLNSRSTP